MRTKRANTATSVTSQDETDDAFPKTFIFWWFFGFSTLVEWYALVFVPYGCFRCCASKKERKKKKVSDIYVSIIVTTTLTFVRQKRTTSTSLCTHFWTRWSVWSVTCSNASRHCSTVVPNPATNALSTFVRAVSYLDTIVVVKNGYVSGTFTLGNTLHSAYWVDAIAGCLACRPTFIPYFTGRALLLLLGCGGVVQQ